MITMPPPNRNEQREIDPLLRQRPGAQLPPPPPRPSARTAAPQGPRPAAPKKKKHAKGSKAASLAIASVTTVGLAAAFSHSDQAAGSGLATVAPVTPATQSTTVATTATTTPATTASSGTTGTTGTTATTAAPTTAASAGIPDGTYVGTAYQNRWGIVQVQAVYSGGQLTDVQILQYPDGDRKSISINNRALPTLISQSISAQSADINGVSGATYTSNSYVQSLQSAIDAAQAAG